MNIIKRFLLRLKFKKFCKLNGYYCPDCICHNFVWDGVIFKGNKCQHPLAKYDN